MASLLVVMSLGEKHGLFRKFSSPLQGKEHQQVAAPQDSPGGRDADIPDHEALLFAPRV